MSYLIESLPDFAGDDSCLVGCEEIRWDVPDMALLFRMLGLLGTDKPYTTTTPTIDLERHVLCASFLAMREDGVKIPLGPYCKNNSKILNGPYLSSLIQFHPHSHFFFLKKIKKRPVCSKEKASAILELIIGMHNFRPGIPPPPISHLANMYTSSSMTQGC